MSNIRKHLSYANVMATMAMMLALGGGTAVALSGSNTVNSGDIINGQVKSADAKDNGIKGTDIKRLEDEDLGRVLTGSFNLGSIGAHTCLNATFDAIPGADDQDMILVTPTGTGIPETNFDTGGELVMFGIPHGGESHVKVCNVSAGAIDPGTVTYRAVLIEG